MYVVGSVLSGEQDYCKRAEQSFRVNDKKSTIKAAQVTLKRAGWKAGGCCCEVV